MSRADEFYASSLKFHMTPGSDVQGVRTGHRLAAHDSNGPAGWMSWDHRADGQAGTVSNVYTAPGLRRRGVATAMWQHAQTLANQGVVNPPKHSPARTPMGTAWVNGMGNTERGV